MVKSASSMRAERTIRSIGEPSTLVCMESVSETSPRDEAIRQNMIPRVHWMAKKRNGIHMVAETLVNGERRWTGRTSQAGDEVMVLYHKAECDGCWPQNGIDACEFDGHIPVNPFTQFSNHPVPVL